jgi:aromatic-L-amino-acid decarboxylase
MRSYGLNGMKAFIRNGVQLGNFFAGKIRSRADLFEIVTTPAYGLTVFRVRNPATAQTVTNGDSKTQVAVDEKCNTLTKEVYERISARGEVYLTSTAFAGVYAIRVVTSNIHSQEKYTQRVFDMLVEAAEGVLKE